MLFLFPTSSTIWYELQARDWPITNQPVEATIWQVGSGEGIKKILAEISLGKEVTVSWTMSVSVIQKCRCLFCLCKRGKYPCWCNDIKMLQQFLGQSIVVHSAVSAGQWFASHIETKWFLVSGNPFCLLGVRLERKADLYAAGWHAGEATQTQPQTVPPWTFLEVCRVGIPEMKDGVKTLDLWTQKPFFPFSYLFIESRISDQSWVQP